MVVLKNTTLKELASSFDSRGYALIMSRRVSYSLTVEESIVSALLKREQRLIEGIPLMLAKNRVNCSSLKKLIDKHHLWNEFGYIGEFALNHIKSDELTGLVDYCFRHLKSEACLSSSDYEFFKYFQKQEQLRWKLIGGPSYQSLEKQYKRYTR